MISLHTLTLRRGARTLLENATLTIYPGWRVGVIGRNGTGKSTLFAAITGELDADQGSLSLPKDLANAVVAQETPSLPALAIAFVRSEGRRVGTGCVRPGRIRWAALTSKTT